MLSVACDSVLEPSTLAQVKTTISVSPVPLSMMCTRAKDCRVRTVVEFYHDALLVREVQLARLVHAADVPRSRILHGGEVPFSRSVEDVVHFQPLRPQVAHVRVVDAVQVVVVLSCGTSKKNALLVSILVNR